MPLRRKIKNSVGYYSPVELLVREATSNDPEMPNEMLLIKIAHCTKRPYYYAEATRMLWKRLNDKSKNWRHIYKALIAINACLKFGSVNFVKDCQLQLPQFITLSDFENTYESPQCSRLIREKAKHIVAILKDDNLMQHERTEAKHDQQKIMLRQRANSTSLSGPIISERRRTASSIHSNSEFIARSDKEEKEQLALAISLSLKDTQIAEVENSENPQTTSQDLVDTNNLLDLESEESDRKFNAWLNNRYKTNNIHRSGSVSPVSGSPNANAKRKQFQKSKTLQGGEYEASNNLVDFNGLVLGTTHNSTNLRSMDEYPFNVANLGQPLAGMVNESSLNQQPAATNESSLNQQPASTNKAFLSSFGNNLVDFDNLITPAVVKVPDSCVKPSLNQLSSTLPQPLNPMPQFPMQQPLMAPNHNMIHSNGLGVANGNQMPTVFNQPTMMAQLQPQMQPMMTYQVPQQPMMNQQMQQPMMNQQMQQPIMNQQMQQPMMMTQPTLQPTPSAQDSFANLNVLSANVNPFL